MPSSSDRGDPLRPLRRGDRLSLPQQIRMVLQLSFPAIMAQLSTVVMQYIDAAMVGQLGADGSAAIGLVSSSTWLLNGVCLTAFAGFSVLVAQCIGAGDEKRARRLVKEAFVLGLCVSTVLMLLGAALSGAVPRWLGGEERICRDASRYLLVFVLSLPLVEMDYVAADMLRSSGNMRVPSLLNILMCLLDVIFNFFLIFPAREVWGMALPGAGLGVLGAALGTVLARAVTGSIMVAYLLRRCPMLRLRREEPFELSRTDFRLNFRIALPAVIERLLLAGAQIVCTSIVAPLGTVALAANTLTVTAESLCYMPGMGIGTASATVIGQSIGAGRDDLTRRLGWLCTGLGVCVMSVIAVVMYFAAPWMIGLMTPEAVVVEQGAKLLRTVAFAEPFFAMSLVCSGVFRGAGDTKMSSLMSFVSMWLVRLPMASWAAKHYGIGGVWFSYSVELCFRGCIFLARQTFHHWEDTMKKPAG